MHKMHCLNAKRNKYQDMIEGHMAAKDVIIK